VIPTLTDDEGRELLATVRSLNARLDQSFSDFKMEEIPKTRKGYLPSVLDWWEDRIKASKTRQYLLPLAVTIIWPIIGGVAVAVILKTLHL
jgi:hypothetical protein